MVTVTTTIRTTTTTCDVSSSFNKKITRFELFVEFIMVQSDFFEASEEALTDEIALEDIFQAYYDCRKTSAGRLMHWRLN